MTASRWRGPKPTTVDFETDPIKGRPSYPPKPVGVSIKLWGKKSKYYAWGHPTGNNCTKAEAVAALRAVWDGDLLCFHGKFDLDVAEVHLGLPLSPWPRFHDGLFLAYLDDPHQTALGLKPLSERVLGWAPEERDDVVDWLVANQPEAALAWCERVGGKRRKLSPNPNAQNQTYAGAYVAFAPGDLVGAYANGDVDRTEALFRHQWPSIQARGMGPAYDRERELMFILLQMERQGVRVDLPRLRADVARYTEAETRTGAWLRRRLGLPADAEDVELGGQRLVRHLEAAGLVDVAALGVSARDGRPRTTVKAFQRAIPDKVLAGVLAYRSQLHTCLQTFLRNWLRVAEQSGGYIYTSWHHTRGAERNGTRTGRLSSTPPLQNIPLEFDPIFSVRRGDGLSRCPWRDLPNLPFCRSYIVPYEDGHVLVGRDYAGQEMRVFAHYEEAELYEAYQAEPWLDPHVKATDMLSALMGRAIPRKQGKVLGFTLIYGGGAPIISDRLEVPLSEATALKEGYLKAVPGMAELNKELKGRAARNEPFTTWGSRQIFVEPPKVVEGKYRTHAYKMLNLLVQGSSADCTKHAVIAFARKMPKNWRIMLQVHDEIVLSVPTVDMSLAQETLRDAMLSAEFDVPMLSEGEWSGENWHEMTPYDKAGKVVCNNA